MVSREYSEDGVRLLRSELTVEVIDELKEDGGASVGDSYSD